MVKNTIRIIFVILFAAVITNFSLFANNIHPSTDNIGSTHPLHEELYIDAMDYGTGWILGDNNGDSIPDYAVFFDDEGFKVFEVQDFNKDGYMDNFYFYQNNVLIRQELDQNFDRRLDLWVYMTEGVYIEGYERDTDYDGRIDVVKLYAPE